MTTSAKRWRRVDRVASIENAYRRLAAAILKRAALDARRDNGKVALPARSWLVSDPWAAFLLDGLGIARDVVIAWVRRLPDIPNFDS